MERKKRLLDEQSHGVGLHTTKQTEKAKRTPDAVRIPVIQKMFEPRVLSVSQHETRVPYPLCAAQCCDYAAPRYALFFYRAWSSAFIYQLPDDQGYSSRGSLLSSFFLFYPPADGEK